MAEPERPYTAEQLETVSKRDLIMFLQKHANTEFQKEHKLKGPSMQVCKSRSKPQLIKSYNALFEAKAFEKVEGAEGAGASKKDDGAGDLPARTQKLSVSSDPGSDKEVKYKKNVIKKGDRLNFPRKGDMVACFYTGKLQDGTVFDTNVMHGKKAKSAQPLRFKVGTGKVIRGWDEALMTMSSGEKAEVTIEPEWAYGKKGLEGKIPANATLVFEIELVSVGC